jgi:single-stranded DNA-binding protein
MDYALVHLLGRAVADAKLFNIDDEDKVSRAVFDLAMNVPIKKDGQFATKPIYRRIVVWGYYANYVATCQRNDPEGLRGRLISIHGTMDNEVYIRQESDEKVTREIVRIGSPHGIINIIDRRQRTDEQ